MEYAVMYLIGAALCNHWMKTSFLGMTAREMLMDEIKRDGSFSKETHDRLAGALIFIACLIFWPLLLAKALIK